MRITATILSLAVIGQAWALDVESRAGELSTLIDNPSSVTTLTLTGNVNAADLFFIADEMPQLTTLDMSAVTIDDYYGVELHSYRSYPAATIPACTFAGSPITALTLPSMSGLTIGEAAFAGSALEELTVPANVTAMGTGAFAGCRNLTTVTISAPMGVHAFNGCSALTQASLSGVSAITDGAFSGCSSLTTVNGTTAVTTIGAEAFNGCSALQSFEFGSSLTAIGEGAFANSGLTTAALADCHLNEIGARAFANCPALSSVTLPAGVELSQAIFFGDTALTSVTIPDGLEEIPAYAFKGDNNWQPAQLPTSITTIGDYSLMGLDNVEVFSLPADVEYIGTSAMEGWTGLKELSVAEVRAVPELGETVWAGIDQKQVKLFVPSNLFTEFSSTPQWKDFTVVNPSGKVDPVADSVQARAKAWFDGFTLRVESSEELQSVTVRDVQGRVQAAANVAGNYASLDTSSSQEVFYIVTVVTADGRTAIFKLARR